MNLRLNTIYNPLTYDELIKPLIDYGKAYKEVEDAYSTLAAQSESFKDEVNKEINSEAFTLYNKYSTDLSAAIEDFSKGMTVANRNKLLAMKRRYAGEIIPIAKASEALKAANDFRDKAGPDAIFKVNRYTSLDDFLHGQIADNTYTSAKQLAAQANVKALTAGPKLYKEIRAGGDTPVTNSIYNTLWKEAGGDSYDSVGKAQLHEAIMSGINSAAYKLEEEDKAWKIQKDNQARAWAQFRETQMMHDMEAAEKGYKRENGKFVKIETLPEIPEYTSSIDRAFLGLNKDKSQYITPENRALLDDTFLEKFFKNGKFTKPEISTIDKVQSIVSSSMLLPSNIKTGQQKGYIAVYDAIYKLLKGAGYTEDQISTMDKNSVKKALDSVVSDSDATGRMVYRTSLDANATEHLFSKMEESGYKFKPIEGYSKGKNNIYEFVIGGDANVSYSDNKTGSILLDPVSRKFILSYNDEYYELPKDLISPDKVATLEGVFGNQRDDNGEILPSKYDYVNNDIKYIQDKINRGEELTNREHITYVKRLTQLQEMDSLMADMGKEFVKYIGLKNEH